MKDFWWKIKILREEFKEWLGLVFEYGQKRLTQFALGLEGAKNAIVDILMTRRGIHQRSFLHAGMIVLVVAGFIFAPIIKNEYPILAQNKKERGEETPSSVLNILTSAAEMETKTLESEKPRDKMETYKVQGGDTLSSIAQKFGVSLETIIWANPEKLPSAKTTLRPGDELSIPPVTGVVHKVKSGDTVYSIAKKYDVDAQNIVNFPFNTYVDDETFALAIGSTLMVPGGVMPEEVAVRPQVRPVTLVAGGTGQFIWPAQGTITQYPVWYHNALDIANALAPDVLAGDTGTVVTRECLRWGYGCYLILDHGNGYQTLYAHMQAFYVGLGDKVNKGQSLGKMGSTGRSTGTHLHFEVRKNGVVQNPLNYLR